MTENAFNDGGFDYKTFVRDGFEAQAKYDRAAGDRWNAETLKDVDKMVAIGGEEVSAKFADAYEYRYDKMIKYMSHMIEEIIEARIYVPRRSWKNKERSFMDSPELRQEFIAEMYDILLFHRAVLNYAGVTAEEFCAVAAIKSGYNSRRQDHNVNGSEETVRDPAAELQGLCPSASFNDEK